LIPFLDGRLNRLTVWISRCWVLTKHKEGCCWQP
jgi:hypothetical protein